jgi:hypothetical protein|tara:strand:- start:611 stop:868 length:258 start_codon:yes stop_codon:yes gene_type:complete
MFIECYRIPINSWDKSDEEIKKPENKILIPLARIEYVQSAPHNNARAEILLSADKRVHVTSSYEEILSKIEDLGKTTHIMYRAND